MYADYHGFDRSYFEADRVVDPHPAGYGYYPYEPLPYGDFAAEIDAAIGAVGKLLIVGCGYGFPLRYLVANHGWDRAYGMDVSEWVMANRFADVADRIYQGDARNAARYDEIARSAQGPRRWNAVYSEHLLEHFTDAEAITACQNMRDASTGPVIHRIWSGTDTGTEFETAWFNVNTVDEWIALTGHDAADGVYWIDYDDPEASTI